MDTSRPTHNRHSRVVAGIFSSPQKALSSLEALQKVGITARNLGAAYCGVSASGSSFKELPSTEEPVLLGKFHSLFAEGEKKERSPWSNRQNFGAVERQIGSASQASAVDSISADFCPISQHLYQPDELISHLGCMGVAGDLARSYAFNLHSGSTLVTARVDWVDSGEVQAILERNGGQVELVPGSNLTFMDRNSPMYLFGDMKNGFPRSKTPVVEENFDAAPVANESPLRRLA